MQDRSNGIKTNKGKEPRTSMVRKGGRQKNKKGKKNMIKKKRTSTLLLTVVAPMQPINKLQ